MNSVLIDRCYENDFGIDLKSYHRRICRLSENEIDLVKGLNNNGRIVFEDGMSTSFTLTIYDNMLYLMGNKTCYLCSNVIESAYGCELNWVKCMVSPGKVKIKGHTDIRKSGVIVSLFSDLISEISDERRFLDFVDKLTYTFSACEWFKRIYSISSYVRLVTFWNYKQKIGRLYELGLLYPLEFSIYAIYKHFNVKNQHVLKHFIASLAESTNKIFSSDEISNVFKSLSESELEDILALKDLKQNIELDKMDDEYFADLLEIDIGQRYPQFVDGVFNLYYARERANSIFKTPTSRNDYFQILKKNFRALENKIRKGKGYENVGSYFMERLLYDKLCTNFSDLTIDTQYSPPWLHPQRLDIYIHKCNLAVEYHGAQHYLPIDFFGGEDGLNLRKELDQRKKERCIENGVSLFEISYEEDFDFAFENLKSHLVDLLRMHKDNSYGKESQKRLKK